MFKLNILVFLTRIFWLVFLSVIWLITVPSTIEDIIKIHKERKCYYETIFYVKKIETMDVNGNAKYDVYGYVKDRENILRVIFNSNDLLKKKEKNFIKVEQKDSIFSRSILPVYYCNDKLPVFFKKNNNSKMNYWQYIGKSIIIKVLYIIIISTGLIFSILNAMKIIKSNNKIKYKRNEVFLKKNRSKK